MQATKNDNKYLNGKIYTIRSYQTDKYYIGSTIQSLHKRLHGHRTDFKNKPETYRSSFEIVKFDDNYIELLEEFPCENKMQLEKREGELIRKYKNDLVNLFIAGRTKKEYYNENKDIIAENQKKYQIDNKDVLAEQKKQYYIKNKDEITLKAKEQYKCGCGATIAKCERARHNKRFKHIAYLQAIPNIDGI